MNITIGDSKLPSWTKQLQQKDYINHSTDYL